MLQKLRVLKFILHSVLWNSGPELFCKCWIRIHKMIQYDPRPWAWGRDPVKIHKSPSYPISLYHSLRILKLVIFLQLLTDQLFASATPTTVTVPRATAVPSHTTLISFSSKNLRRGFLDLICSVPVPDQTPDRSWSLKCVRVRVWILSLSPFRLFQTACLHFCFFASVFPGYIYGPIQRFFHAKKRAPLCTFNKFLLVFLLMPESLHSILDIGFLLFLPSRHFF